MPGHVDIDDHEAAHAAAGEPTAQFTFLPFALSSVFRNGCYGLLST
jgi:hypothetical protein